MTDVLNKYRHLNSEVMYSKETVTTVDRNDIAQFKQLSLRNSRKRIRLCSHPDQNSKLHEMLIVHERGTYVRPHKHLGKSESTHIIEGLVDMVMFDEAGCINHVIRMGDYASGETFYYRMEVPIFHTLLIRSEVLVFHETTNGPFERQDTVFAPWSPEGGDEEMVKIFMADLDDQVLLLRNEQQRK